MLGSGDGSGLALSEGDPVAPQLPRINHFGFRLEHDQAVCAARERLRDAGVTETEEQGDGRFVRVQVADSRRVSRRAVRLLIQGGSPARALPLADRSPHSARAWILSASRVSWPSRSTEVPAAIPLAVATGAPISHRRPAGAGSTRDGGSLCWTDEAITSLGGARGAKRGGRR